MSTTARRRTTITYSGEVEGEQILDAANNTTSPGTITRIDLADGDNVIRTESFNDVAATAVTIVPDPDNTVALTFKGDEADVGVRLHNTDPTTIALHSSVESFILNIPSESALTVRLYWS